MNPAELARVAAAVLAEAGCRGDFTLHRVDGSANNQVLRVEWSGAPLLLKAYFRHPDDPRDRLGAEFSFSKFAWDQGLRCIAQPLALDPKNALGVYAFVAGRPPAPEDVTAERVREARNFYRGLNRGKQTPAARSLPLASEACFSVREHLRCVERRVEALRSVAGGAALDREASEFIRGELVPVWREMRDSIEKRAGRLGLSVEETIPEADRCLSPSDFGFHNALIVPDGRLCFVDFEYAGWDDPAKLVCDFFCQVKVPVSMTHYSGMAEAAVSGLSRPEDHRRRIALLLPAYRIKWCSILLNDFLPVGGERRRFAGEGKNGEGARAEQLHKAREMLRSLEAVPRA